MRKGHFIFYIFFIFALAANVSQAQEAHRIAMEQTMNEFLTKIKISAEDTTREGQENLWAANIGLMAYLKSMCEVKPQIFSEEFHTVGDIDGNLNGINILTSEDKLLRIYCWDTWTSREKHRFNTLVQYKAFGEINMIPWADVSEQRGRIGKALNCFSEINTVYTKDGKAIYLVMSFGINGGNEGGHELQAYAIDSVLAPVAVFNYYGEMRSLLKVGNDKPIRGAWTEDDTNIKISVDGRSVYVPVVRSANPKRQPVKGEKNYHVYEFDGYQFVYKENLNN